MSVNSPSDDSKQEDTKEFLRRNTGRNFSARELGQPRSLIASNLVSSVAGKWFYIFLLLLFSGFVFIYVNQIFGSIIFAFAMLAWIFNWHQSWEFGSILKFLIIALIVWFILSMTGIGSSYLSVLNIATSEQQTQLENTGFFNSIKVSINRIFTTIKDPTSVYTETPDVKAEVDQNINNQQLGLKVKSFAPISQISFPDEEIQLGAQVLASSLEDDAQVSINCQIPNPQKSQDINNINNAVKYDPPDHTYKLTKGQINLIALTCNYPENTFNLKDSEKLISQKVELLSSYEFRTIAYLDTFTLPYDVLQTHLTPDGIDYATIFEKESTSLRSEGKAISTSSYGPMTLAMDLIEPQPLTEEGPTSNNLYYTLDVELRKTSPSFTGKLKQLKQLKIDIPKNLEVSETSLSKVSTDNGVTTYKLTDDQIASQNQRFANPSILDPKLNIWFKFKVNELNPNLKKTFISAEALYVYEDKYSTNVKIAKRTEETNEASII